jgi:hypothetical protein
MGEIRSLFLLLQRPINYFQPEISIGHVAVWPLNQKLSSRSFSPFISSTFTSHSSSIPNCRTSKTSVLIPYTAVQYSLLSLFPEEEAVPLFILLRAFA